MRDMLGEDPTSHRTWRMSATLENVRRDGSEMPSVTSLDRAVREWCSTDPELQAEARLTLKRPIALGSGCVAAFTGNAIDILVELLLDKDRKMKRLFPAEYHVLCRDSESSGNSSS